MSILTDDQIQKLRENGHTKGPWHCNVPNLTIMGAAQCDATGNRFGVPIHPKVAVVSSRYEASKNAPNNWYVLTHGGWKIASDEAHQRLSKKHGESAFIACMESKRTDLTSPQPEGSTASSVQTKTEEKG